MSFPVTLNGRTYTLADFEGTNYVQGFPDALEDFVTHAGDTLPKHTQHLSLIHI